MEKKTSHRKTPAGKDLWRSLVQAHAHGRGAFRIRSRCSEPLSFIGYHLLHLSTTCSWKLRGEEVQGRWPCLNSVALPTPPLLLFRACFGFKRHCLAPTVWTSLGHCICSQEELRLWGMWEGQKQAPDNQSSAFPFLSSPASGSTNSSAMICSLPWLE